MVPKEGVEPTHPKGYYVLNVARLPFRHFGPFRFCPLRRFPQLASMVGGRGFEPRASCV